MTKPISQDPVVKPGNQKTTHASITDRVPDFVRKGDTASPFELAGSHPKKSDGVIYTEIAPPRQRPGAPAARANRIPVNTKPISPAFGALKANSKQLIAAIDNMRNSSVRQSGKTFVTSKGEPAVVRQNSKGEADILVNGKPMFECFVDNGPAGEVHVLMLGPDGRMHAGRNLPPDYLARANDLVSKAQAAISGRGFVRNQVNRLGN